MTVCECSRV
ncbi:hypothetical protein VCHE40_3168A, partial [Vibrio cholerae HE-40]